MWDVGANIGFYTSRFLNRVGPDGRVIAFEPAPACFDKLRGTFHDNERIHLENVALGSEDRQGWLRLDPDALAPTHQVVAGAGADWPPKGAIGVTLITADSFFRLGNAAPDVVKIDVEGFEEEVLKGMPELLRSVKLRAIFIEIHFRLLEDRGEPLAPMRIEALLRAAGFSTRWVDFSHLAAVR